MDSEARCVDDGRLLGGADGEVDPGAPDDNDAALREGGGRRLRQLSARAPEYVPGQLAETPDGWPGTDQAAHLVGRDGGDGASPSAALGGAAHGRPWAQAWPHEDALWHTAPPGPVGFGCMVRRRPALDAQSKAERGIAQLRQLLDFCFEPFNVQHDRHLLDLIARTVGAPRKAGPWPAETLEEFSFKFEDLMGLGRISSALLKARVSSFEALAPLRHLRLDPSGRLRLTHPPEVRSFVAAPDARPGSVDMAARWLIAVREDRVEASIGIMSVLSLALTEAMARKALNQQQPSQLKRQLLLHHTDVICLQGVDPESRGRSIAAALQEEGYLRESASHMAQANSIFWDAGRFELVGSLRAGSSLAVDLRPFEDPGVQVRVVCMMAHPPFGSASASFADLFARPAGAPGVVVCADLGALGGAESACLVEEFADLTSMSQEVLGVEVCAPRFEHSADGNVWPVRAPASGLNRLRHPDVMLFGGLCPLIALSGHSERYVSTLGQEELLSQFPAFRPTLVAAFDWRGALQ